VELARSFFIQLATCFDANSALAVTHVDFTGNTMEEKGAISFAGVISQMKKGMISLNLTRCSLEKKGVIQIARAIEAHEPTNQSLTSLTLTGNKFDPESSKSLAGVISKCSQLKELIIGSTFPDFHLLSNKKSESITTLDISGLKWIMKDSKHLDTIKLLQYLPNLSKLNISKSTIPTEIFNDIIMAVPKLRDLDISDCSLGDSGLMALVDSLKNNLSLSVLNISNNFEKPSKQRTESIRSLINYLNAQSCGVDTLHVTGSSRSQLKNDLVPLIFSMMANKTLKTLDVTGNQAGNTLALALSKMLQVNRTLESLTWDDNGTTIGGFLMFKQGLLKNKILRHMPLPSVDIHEYMNRAKDSDIEKITKDIQEILFKNVTSRRLLEEEEQEDTTTSNSQINLERSVSSPNMMRSQASPTNLSQSVSESRLPPARSPPATPATAASTPASLSTSTSTPAPLPSIPIKPPKPRPVSKYHKMKPEGIDTAHVSKLFGQLNDMMAIAADSKELSPEEIEQMKQKIKADTK